MWLYLSIGISLNPSTPFIYCLIPIGLFPDIPNFIYLLSRIGFPTSYCWEAHLPLSSAVIWQSSHLFKIPPVIILPCWNSVLLFRFLCFLFCFISIYYHNVVWLKSENFSNIAWAYLVLGWMTRYSVTENIEIVGIILKLLGLGLKTWLEEILDG